MVFGTKMVIRELEKSFMRHLRLAWFSCGRPLLMFLIFFFLLISDYCLFVFLCVCVEFFFLDTSMELDISGYFPGYQLLLSCWDQLNKQGFQKCDTVREWEMRHKNSEKSENQGTNTSPRWRFQNWIQASSIILSAVNEGINGELNYNSCGLQGRRTKWSLTIE